MLQNYAVIYVIWYCDFSVNVLNFVFVDAEKAVSKLNNRFFAGRRIQAQIYDMEQYKNNDLSS